MSATAGLIQNEGEGWWARCSMRALRRCAAGAWWGVLRSGLLLRAQSALEPITPSRATKTCLAQHPLHISLLPPSAHHAVRKGRRARHQHHPHPRGTCCPSPAPPLSTRCPAIAALAARLNTRPPAVRAALLTAASSIADRCRALGRCHGQGQLGPSGRAHGHGPGGPRPVQQVHDLQSQEPRLGQPRPLRSLVRARLPHCRRRWGLANGALFDGERVVVAPPSLKPFSAGRP